MVNARKEREGVHDVVASFHRDGSDHRHWNHRRRDRDRSRTAIAGSQFNIVRWIDLEKFAASPGVLIPSVPLRLHHLNPLFASVPPIPVTLERGSALMVPVAKNGVAPPPP